MTDRELQDEIIRYVTDPRARGGSSPALKSALKLSAQQAKRAAQFARFLARRYYRDRLGRSFRYSALLSGSGGRRATDVVDAGEFEVSLGDGVLGSFHLA